MKLMRSIRDSLLWPMVRKEFIQMRRDRFTLAMLLGIPAMQLILFGFAIRTDVRNLPMAVLDESRSPESRRMIEVLEQTGNFVVVAAVTDRDQMRQLIERGTAKVAIVIPPTFARDIARGSGATAQIVLDAADPLTSSAAIGAAAIVGTVLPQALAKGPIATAPLVDVRIRPWYNPALRSSTFIVPGIVAVLLTMTFLLVMSVAVVREREGGTLEQLVVTPVTKSAILLGKVVPFVLIGYAQMTNILVLGALIFRAPMRGSILLLYLLTLPFILAVLGLGLLIATIARTQGSAQQLALFFVMPSILLSGFIFPRAAMPEAAQWIGTIVPATWYLDILRGVMLKGAGIEALWQPTLALVAIAVVTLSVSIRRFAKTVE